MTGTTCYPATQYLNSICIKLLSVASKGYKKRLLQACYSLLQRELATHLLHLTNIITGSYKDVARSRQSVYEISNNLDSI